MVFGPSMENFKDISEALLAGGGALQCLLETLGTDLVTLLNDKTRQTIMGSQAHAVLEKARGATERTLDLLENPL